MSDNPSCKRAYTDLSGRMHQGVRGVRILGSGLPGPTIGLIMASSPATVPTLAAYADLWMRHLIMPNRGKIIWVINSLAACDAVLWQKEIPAQTDMTELPTNLSQRMDDTLAIRRAQELMPIWSTLDAALELTLTEEKNPWLAPIINWNNESTAAMALPTGPAPQSAQLTAKQFYGSLQAGGQSSAAVAQLYLPVDNLATWAHTPIRSLLTHWQVLQKPNLSATA
jgi:hypothetical protein